MIKKMKISEKVDIDEMDRTCADMMDLLNAFAMGKVPNAEYTLTDLQQFCESLVKTQRNDIEGFKPGSWPLAPKVEQDGEARVDFVFRPTYIAVSILTRFRMKYPDEAKRILGFDDALRQGLKFSTYRNLEGHGTWGRDDVADNLKILELGDVPRHVLQNPSPSPEMAKVLDEYKDRLHLDKETGKRKTRKKE